MRRRVDGRALAGRKPRRLSYGHAKRGGNEIAFLFNGPNGSVFHTTFAYDKAANTWRWLMDDEEGGRLQPFARVKLTKKKWLVIG